jgi:hypothetical protein
LIYFDYEKDNVGFWNSSRGDKDGSAGEGIPKKL